MKKLIAAAAALVFMLVSAPPAFADQDIETEKRCTRTWILLGDDPPGTNDWDHYQVCMRLQYNDQGDTVVLRRVVVWMPYARPNHPEDGYYFDNLYVKCGPSNWWINVTGKVHITNDNLNYEINPNNELCWEDQVEFGGIGIINITNGNPDKNDDFGEDGNYLPN